MNIEPSERPHSPVAALFSRCNRAPAHVCFAVAAGFGLGAVLAAISGRRATAAFAAASALLCGALALRNRRPASNPTNVESTSTAPPDLVPSLEERDQPFDYVDEMSAASFPASDPPAGPASIGPPTWPARSEPRQA